MKRLNIENLDLFTPEEEKEFWFVFETELANDDGAAAQEHLAAGRAVTYRSSHHNGGLMREWPDGRLELIQADLSGNVQVLRTIRDGNSGSEIA